MILICRIENQGQSSITAERNMEYVIEDTKTTSGTREIPMSDEVYACFQRIIANRKKVKKEPMINGKCGFLYLDKMICQW